MNEELKVLQNIEKKIDKIAKRPLWRFFLQGILTGLGTVLGATIVLAIAIAFLRNFITVPLIGQWVSDIINVVDVRNK